MGFAIKGIAVVCKERNFRIQLTIMILTGSFGLYFNISSSEWLTLLCFGALVLGSEAINTSIERLCDLYSIDQDPRIARIKDVAAGAVLLICMFALIAGIIIFSKYFF